MKAEEVATKLAELAYEKVYHRVFTELVKLEAATGQILEIKHVIEVGGVLVKTDEGYIPKDESS